MKYTVAILILAFVVMFAGCLEPTGCIPVTIQDKYILSSPNTQSLGVVINNVNYTYGNPTLDMYSIIEINKTYLVKFEPMFAGKPDVVLCEGST